jgi:predicted kinase
MSKHKGNMRNLFLIRGLPNSGKTTLAEEIAWTQHAADDYFESLAKEQGKTYSEVFDPKLLGEAHKACQEAVEDEMAGSYHNIAVHNTFSQEWELKPYLDLAEKHNFKVFVLTIEKHHNNSNDHEVPEEAITRMVDRWEYVDKRFKR